MDERRTTIRVPAGVEGTYQVLQRATPPRLGVTEDLSPGGMRFACPDLLYPGDNVAVKLNFPNEGTVALTGVVRWSREFVNSNQEGCEAGLLWTEIDPHAQARLNAFLSDRTQTETAVLFSKPQLPVLIRWPLAITTGLVIASGLLFCGWVWFRQSMLSHENNILHALVRVYQDHVDRLLR